MTRIVVLDPESVLAFSGSGSTISIDISAFTNTDFLSVACPEFPRSKLNLAQSFLEITSNDEGDFNVTSELDRIPFSSSTTSMTTNDVELRFPLSLLVNVNRAQITGVRFSVYATAACNFRVMALRCVSADWVQAPIDFDTLNNSVRRPVPRDGSLGNTGTFPATSQPGLPSAWPIVFRSSDIPSSQDPKPIDASVAIDFKRGSVTSATGDEDYAATFTEGGEVSVPTTSALNFAGAFTLEAWIKPTSLSDWLGIVSKYDPSAGNRGYRFGVTASGELIFDWSTNGSGASSITTVGAGITTGVWQHVAVTYAPGTQAASLPLLLNPTGTAVRFYKDGEQIYARTGLPTETNVFATNRPFKISAWNTG